jgi:hypothetical protein
LSVPTAAGIATLQALDNANGNMMLTALNGVQAASSQGNLPIGARTACPASAVNSSTGQCQVEWGYYRRNDIGKNLSREWTARADYNLTNDSVFVRYTDSYQSSSPDLFANPGALPYADTQQSGPARIFGSVPTLPSTSECVTNISRRMPPTSLPIQGSIGP